MNRLQLFATNRPVEVIHHWVQSGYLDFDPPYQRGEVWGLLRRQNFIKSIVQGIPIASMIINDRSRNEWAEPICFSDPFLVVIDGKQRMTTVLAFLNNQFEVPGEWFDVRGLTVFSELPTAKQRGFRNHPLAFSEGSLRTIEEEREVFELVNFGGVPQGQTDL